MACGCSGSEQLWSQVDRVHGRDLVASVIGAARAHVAYSRSISSAKRAAALLGRGAGREQEFQAERHHARRRAQFVAAKHALATFAGAVGKDERKQAADFLRRGGAKQLAEDARGTAIVALLDSDVTPEEARNALKGLDAGLERVAGLKSFENVVKYLDQRFDEMIAKPMGNADGYYALCVFLLLLVSIYLLLLVLAVLICAITLGLGCGELFNNLLAQACD